MSVDSQALSPREQVRATAKHARRRFRIPGGRFRDPLLVSVVIVLLLLAGTRHLLFSPGMPLWGDFSSLGSNFARQMREIWDTVQYGGMVNYDLRTWPWMAPLGLLAGSVGTERFALVNRIFIVASIAVPLVVGTYCAASMRKARSIGGWLLAIAAGITFAGNPWSVAQLAAGHPSLVIGVGLFPAVALVTIRRRGWRWQPVVLGTLLAIEGALSFQAAALAVIIVAAYLAGRPWRQTLRTFVLSLFAAVVASFYWIIPLALALRKIPPGSSLGSTRTLATSTVGALSHLGDPLHIFGARAFWWRPFSDGIYESAGIGATEPALLAISFAVLIILASTYLGVSDAVLIVLGVVPQVFAHAWPAAYASIVRMPVFGLFLDPSYFTVFYLIVLWRAIALLPLSARTNNDPTDPGASPPKLSSSGIVRRISSTGGLARWSYKIGAILVIVAVFATLLPWRDGDLRGTLQTSPSRSPLTESVLWVNSHLPTTTLWLPVSPYIQSGGQVVNDPVRFWTATPVANPYAPAYYDSSPSYGANLLDFEYFFEGAGSQKSDLLLLRSTIGRVLARAGISGLVVRWDALASESAHRLEQVLRGAPGVEPAASFDRINVYRITGTPVGRAWTTGLPELVDAGWYGLSLATASGVSSSQPLVQLHQEGIPSLIASYHRLGSPLAAVLPTPFEMVFGQAPLEVPPQLKMRSWYMFDGLPGYAMQSRETATVPAEGIAAFEVVGGDQVTATCAGSAPSPPPAVGSLIPSMSKKATSTEPTTGRRWIFIRCSGQAELRFARGGGQWYLGSVTMSTSEFEQRLDQVASAMSVPGSAYVFTSAETTNALVNGMPGFVSLREDAALVDSGDFRLEVKGGTRCHPEDGYLWPSSGHTIHKRLAGPAGARSAEVYLPKGMYQLLVTGDIASCSTLILTPVTQSMSPPYLSTVAFEDLAKQTNVPRAAGFLYQGNGGPWTVEATLPDAPALRANGLETWYPTGSEAKINPGLMGHSRQLLFLAYLLGIGGLMILTRIWRDRSSGDPDGNTESAPESS